MPDTVTLPRTLVVKLLSLAYTYNEAPLQGLLRKRDDRRMEFVPLTTDSTLPVIGEEIYGTYQNLPSSANEPDLDGLPMRHGMVHVGFNLTDDGVLQLRAWRQQNDELVPEDVEVIET